ncbi:hypothetical protein KFE25_006042 [Diacronema lutheri]|uniref:Uncharacterized protein n=2 Tax=Diacronema lutheri TaxID=2081491 RepID=A0A8J5XVV5_DIALT|nr:hypothetical protein KFE25_006042 [Diacronema lutheri]
MFPLRLASVALGICALLGSSAHVNWLARTMFSRSSITFSNITLELTPQQFYGRIMARSTMKHFFPFTSTPVDGATGFGAGAIALRVYPLGYYILHHQKWEYSGSVFTSTPTVLTHQACFTHRLRSARLGAERCLVTLAERVEIEPVAPGKVSVRRTLTDLVPRSPIAGIVANLCTMHMELHHHLALNRDWAAV